MTGQQAVTHASFTVERTYRAAPAKVFAAFCDPAAKRRWLVEGEGFTVESYEPGFGVGAFERSSFRFQAGPLVRNDTVYMDVLQDRRIVFAYSMTLEDKPMSTSLATVLFEPQGAGTRMIFTEQGAYLAGFDDVAGRENGTRELLEALDRELEQRAVAI
jgi:uncharacterized protein YndB with AHSA1/START domain